MKVQEIELHDGQYEVATDPHRFKVIRAGRRWGKSVLSRMIMLKWALETPGDYWIVGPTNEITKKVHWDQGYRREIDPKSPYIKKFLDSYPLTIEFNNGSTIQLKSAEKPDSLIGVKLHGLIIDEIAKMRHWNWLWNEALRPTLTDHRAPAIFISTPKGFNHFHDLYQLGQGKNKDYKSWHFTSYDNPYIPSEEIDQAKDEIPIEKFNQEYLAEFTRFTGIIYKEFDEMDHVNIFDHEKNQKGNYLLGLDFATRGYVAATITYHDSNDHYYVLDCYKEEGLTAKEHAASILKMMREYADLKYYEGFADPSGWASNQQGIKAGKPMNWSLAEEYQEEGISLVRGNNKVLGGINYVRQLLKDNKITIHPRCQDLIDELHEYQWKEQPERLKTEKSDPEEPRKYNDHLVDAWRYSLYSKQTPIEEDDPRPKWGDGERIKFKPWNYREEDPDQMYDDKFTRIN